MRKIHDLMEIPKSFYIYHINTNEIMIQRLLKREGLLKKNIIAFHYQNRMNVDIFFWTRNRIEKGSKDTGSWNVFKDDYRDENVFLNVYFPGSSFITELKKEKKFNSSVYAMFEPGLGAFFISKSGKTKRIIYTNINNYLRLETLEFQLSMFDSTDKKIKLIETFRAKSIENENKLTEYLS